MSSIEKATSHIQQGEYKPAKEILERLFAETENKEKVVSLQVEIAKSERNLEYAKQCTKRLFTSSPTNTGYFHAAREFAQLDNEPKHLSFLYEYYLKHNKGSATDYFNSGYYARKAANAKLSILHFQQALEGNISDKHEVYRELALVYSELLNNFEQAKSYLEKALELNKEDEAALFNLAALYEFYGDRNLARDHFHSVLALNPHNTLALSRLSDLNTFDIHAAHEYEQKCLKAIESSDPDNRCDLYYALGKAHDDAAQYKKAWDYYVQANKLNKRLVPEFDANALDRLKLQLTERSILKPIARESNAHLEQVTPIIICGMFRSGSTLVEQILGANSQVTVGGEIDYLHLHLRNLSNEALQAKLSDAGFIEGYESHLKALSSTPFITDKRPENYLYLDVIKTLYPKAKIIWTQRKLADNGLSAYFQRLGPTLNYATNLDAIAKVYNHQLDIKQHWQKEFAKDIVTLQYEELVDSPETTIRSLFEDLGLNYTDEANTFYKQKNLVKTASVWQVRKPLFKTSVNRIDNYERYIRDHGEYAEFLKASGCI